MAQFVRAEVCDYSLRSDQKAIRVGEPLGQHRLSQHLRGKIVCSCVLQASLFLPGDAPLGGLQGTPLPNPNISFHLWTEDDQLCECPGGLRQVWTVPEAGKP